MTLCLIRPAVVDINIKTLPNAIWYDIIGIGVETQGVDGKSKKSERIKISSVSVLT